MSEGQRRNVVTHYAGRRAFHDKDMARKHRAAQDTPLPPACGASWEIVEQTVRIAEPDVPPIWTRVSGNCSVRCVETGKASIDQFQAALYERRRRGW